MPLQQVMARQQIINGTARRPLQGRIPAVRHRQQFLGAPSIFPPHGQDQRLLRAPGAVRTVVRRVTAIRERGAAAGAIPGHPFIARRARHPKARTQLAHRPVPTLERVDKLLSLVQRLRFHPRHLPGVNHPAGLLLTLNPVYTP